MFFDLLNTPLKRAVSLREMPPVPVTNWQPPQYFPNLDNAQVISYDTETKELDFDNGPGWGRNAGHIIGVSVAATASDGTHGKWYFPVRHEVEREHNLDARNVFGWLKHTLEQTPHVPKVGANLLYDNGWLTTENIYPVGPQYDVQFAEAMIDEQSLVGLDNIGRKYVQQGKQSTVLEDWITAAYRPLKGKWKSDLWRTPPRLVGPYAEDDADLPMRILPAQWAIMQREGTLPLYLRECLSIPMLIKMRLQGITVDIGMTEQLREEIAADITDLYSKLSYKSGIKIDNVTSPKQLVTLFDHVGMAYPKTAAGNPSFKKEWLKTLGDTDDDATDTIFAMINKIREREKLRDTFIDSYILSRATSAVGGSNGRSLIYCSFHPLRGEGGGTKTGRYSSSHPNLQNIPARTKLGKRVREAFVCDDGHVGWHKKDHSQIEYRLFAHYAVGPRSDEMRHRYQNDPSTDYHNDTMIDVAAMRQLNLAAMSEIERDLFRKPIKNVNFGLLYGQMEKSLAFKAGWSKEEADAFFGAYHAGRPFVKSTMEAIQAEVQQYGYITTIQGRRTRFNQWQTKAFDETRTIYTHDVAVSLFGSAIKRAYAYRAINYRFQGSAADVLKEGMLQCYEQGVYDVIGYPKLQVHDELDWSKIAHTKEQNEAFAYATHVMENAIKCRVPLKVDSSEGINWGACK